MPVCVAISSAASPFSPDAATAFKSPSNTALNGCCVFHSGCCGASARTRSSANRNWKIEWLLRPQRPVIVEHRDAITGLDIATALLAHRGIDERDDARLHWSLVPRRQRIG